VGTDQTLPPGWSVAAAGPWRVHRRWVTSLGRQTIGRRLRRRILGSLAPGEIDDLSFDFEDLIFGGIKWIVKIVLILVIVPVVLVFVWLVGLVETIGRVVLRRPWAVDGFGRDGTQVRWRAPSLLRAKDRRDEIRVALATGAAPQGGDIKSGPG